MMMMMMMVMMMLMTEDNGDDGLSDVLKLCECMLYDIDACEAKVTA